MNMLFHMCTGMGKRICTPNSGWQVWMYDSNRRPGLGTIRQHLIDCPTHQSITPWQRHKYTNPLHTMYICMYVCILHGWIYGLDGSIDGWVDGSCLGLKVISSTPACSTIIFRFLCVFVICISQGAIRKWHSQVWPRDFTRSYRKGSVTWWLEAQQPWYWPSCPVI